MITISIIFRSRLFIVIIKNRYYDYKKSPRRLFYTRVKLPLCRFFRHYVHVSEEVPHQRQPSLMNIFYFTAAFLQVFHYLSYGNVVNGVRILRIFLYSMLWRVNCMKIRLLEQNQTGLPLRLYVETLQSFLYCSV